MPESANGDRLRVRLRRGGGPGLNGMTGRARFRDGAMGETTTVLIADSEILEGLSALVFFDADDNPVVIFDIAGAQGVEVTWMPDGILTGSHSLVA